jgi:hypothetical protein
MSRPLRATMLSLTDITVETEQLALRNEPLPMPAASASV